MKAFRLLAGMVALIITLAPISTIVAQQVSVTIDQIVANKHISGYVHGVNPAEYSKYKVVFYVHTDQWYIHPYAGQDEGLSWASIKENGTWQIKTVQREFKANSVAALVVDRQYPEPNKVENLQRIPHRAILIKELRNTEDYGKL